jgi:hypothetical protein
MLEFRYAKRSRFKNGNRSQRLRFPLSRHIRPEPWKDSGLLLVSSPGSWHRVGDRLELVTGLVPGRCWEEPGVCGETRKAS